MGYNGIMSGWWFGTWLLFFHSVGIVIIPIEQLIFFRRIETTKQPIISLVRRKKTCRKVEKKSEVDAYSWKKNNSSKTELNIIEIIYTGEVMIFAVISWTVCWRTPLANVYKKNYWTPPYFIGKSRNEVAIFIDMLNNQGAQCYSMAISKLAVLYRLTVSHKPYFVEAMKFCPNIGLLYVDISG